MQLNQILQQALDPNATDDNTEDVTPTEPETTPTPAEPEGAAALSTEPTPAPEAKPTEPATPKSNPMKEVRDRLNQEQKAKERIDSAINRFAAGDYAFKIKDFKTEDGKVDYEAFIKAMDEADLKARSAERGISPEVQAEIERIEREKKELQKDRMRVAMDRALASLQTSRQLSNSDINKFFNDSMALNKNPYTWLAQGGTLDDLYYLVYRETITQSAIDKAVEEAKALWSNPAVVTPTPNPAAPATSSKDPKISVASLLKQAGK